MMKLSLVLNSLIILVVLFLALPATAQRRRFQSGLIQLLCNERHEIARRPFGEKKSIVKYEQYCLCYLYWDTCLWLNLCPKKSDEDCEEVCTKNKRYEDVETTDEENSGDDLGPNSVKTLCKEEQEISREPLGEKYCRIKIRRKCGCTQDRTSGSSPNEGESCECSDTICEEDFEFERVEEKEKDGNGGGTGGDGRGGGGTGGGGTGGSGRFPRFCRNRTYCERETVQYRIIRDLSTGAFTGCFQDYIKRCDCIVGDDGSVRSDPDADLPCTNCLRQPCRTNARGECFDESGSTPVPLQRCIDDICGSGSGDDRKRRGLSSCSYDRSCVYDGSCCDDFFEICVNGSASASAGGYPTCYTEDEGCCNRGDCCSDVECI